MQRDMSSPMDASLSSRGNGQLINTQSVVTQARRIGNMQPVPMDSRGVRPLPVAGVVPAAGLQDLTVTGLGTTSLKWVLLSMAAGAVAFRILYGKKTSKQRRQEAISALKD